MFFYIIVGTLVDRNPLFHLICLLKLLFIICFVVRCTRVVLGGSAIERGRKASSFAAVACNNLRCLQCNFTVHCFSGYAWDNTVDYMFLRNTVPNEVKLSSKLVSSQQSCAYCCQCSFASESADRQLTQGAKNDPQWICAGH